MSLSPEQHKRLTEITNDPHYIPVGLKVCSADKVDSVLDYMESKKKAEKQRGNQ